MAPKNIMKKQMNGRSINMIMSNLKGTQVTHLQHLNPLESCVFCLTIRTFSRYVTNILS